MNIIRSVFTKICISVIIENVGLIDVDIPDITFDSIMVCPIDDHETIGVEA